MGLELRVIDLTIDTGRECWPADQEAGQSVCGSGSPGKELRKVGPMVK